MNTESRVMPLGIKYPQEIKDFYFKYAKTKVIGLLHGWGNHIERMRSAFEKYPLAFWYNPMRQNKQLPLSEHAIMLYRMNQVKTDIIMMGINMYGELDNMNRLSIDGCREHMTHELIMLKEDVICEFMKVCKMEHQWIEYQLTMRNND